MVIGLELLCHYPDSRDWYCSGGKASNGRQVYLFTESGAIPYNWFRSGMGCQQDGYITSVGSDH